MNFSEKYHDKKFVVIMAYIKTVSLLLTAILLYFKFFSTINVNVFFFILVVIPILINGLIEVILKELRLFSF